MKINLFAFALIFTFSIQAEIKPPGSLVTYACGANVLESAFENAGYPEYVCLESVTPGSPLEGPQRPVVSIKSAEGVKFYVVLVQVEIDAQTQSWFAFEVDVEKRGNYLYLSETLNLSQGGIEMTRTTRNSLGGSLSGNLFHVEMQAQPTTQSVQ